LEEGKSSLLELYPKRILSLSRGKFEGGLLTPFDLKEEIPHFVRNDGVDDFLSFGEKLGEFSTSFQITV